MSIELVTASSHLILCRPPLLLPPIPPSIRVFSNESVLYIRWLKYWNFSFSVSPSSEHPGLISFRMDWLDLLAVQGTLKSLLQHHSSKASILQHSAFFIVQLSHPYMTTGKTIALTRQTLVLADSKLQYNECAIYLYKYPFIFSFSISNSNSSLMSCFNQPSFLDLNISSSWRLVGFIFLTSVAYNLA